MTKKRIDLIAFDKNEKLQYEGKCKVIINILSELLLVEPYNEEYKMISAMFTWRFVAKKNILFVFAEHNFQDFALVFDEESRCQKLFEILVNKKVETGSHDLIVNRFLPSMCTAIAETNNVKLKEIFSSWIEKLEHSEDKEEYIQILKEKDVYELVFPCTLKLIPATNMMNDNIEGRNLRKRKAKVMTISDEDLNGTKSMVPVPKKNKYNRYQIIVEKPNYEIIHFEHHGIQKSRLCIFTSTDKELCYEYYYQKRTKIYRCGKCEMLKKTLTAKICERKNGQNVVRLSSSEHVCKMRKYDPSKYFIKEEIVKKPNFRTITYYQRGSQRTTLIIFDSINPKLCYEYFWCKRIMGYLCCGCRSKNPKIKQKTKVKAKICQDNGGSEYVKLGRTKHVCEMQEFNPEKYNDDINIYKPDYELFEGIVNGSEIKYLYIFTDKEKKLCYKFSYRPKYDKATGALLKKRNYYTCSKCCYKSHYISAVIQKDENGQDMAVVKNKKKHICEPIEFILPKITVSKILKPPNYQLVKRRSNGKIVQHLVVFDSNDKSLCYDYTKQKVRNSYICNPCSNQHKTSVLAWIKTDNNNEEYVELSQNEHKCSLKNFVPENIDNILKEPDFKIEKYMRAGIERPRILVFDKNDRSYFFVYSWRERDNYVCNHCRKFQKTVSVKLCQNDDGENYIEINGEEHLCKPRNKF